MLASSFVGILIIVLLASIITEGVTEELPECREREMLGACEEADEQGLRRRIDFDGGNH